MNDAIVGNIIMGFVILEAIHMFLICWLVNRFTDKPLFKKRELE